MKDLGKARISDVEIGLNDTEFFGDVIRTLTGELEATVGLAEAEGYISVVGRALGDQIAAAYDQALDEPHRGLGDVAEVLVDLKRRIGGEFSVSSISENQVVFGNSRCPFGDKVINRPSLCMMTTNVFGRIASKACGYAHVDAVRSIARGDACCQVVVTIDEDAADPDNGYEFFG